MVFGIGGGSSSSSSSSQQQIWGPQARLLQEFWPQVMEMFEAQNQNIFDYGTELSQEMTGRLDRAGTAYEDIIGGRSPGAGYMQQRLSEGNPYLEGAITGYGEDIARNLAQNILPELRSGGVAAGSPGGSRSYIAQGLAAQGAQREFARGANQMRLQDLAQTDALAGQYSAMQMAAAQGMTGLTEASYNLGMAPYSAAWMPALNMASVLGAPVPLTSSDSESDSIDFNLGF